MYTDMHVQVKRNDLFADQYHLAELNESEIGSYIRVYFGSRHFFYIHAFSVCELTAGAER